MAKIVLVCDAQSPHSQNWIKLLAGKGHEIHLVSTYPIEPSSLPIKDYLFAPVDFSAKTRAEEKAASLGTGEMSAKGKIIHRLRGTPLWKALVQLRAKLAPKAIKKTAPSVSEFIQKVKPDLVHALRIPYEGLLLHEAVNKLPYPFVQSTWGNDFTLHAEGRKIIGDLTKAHLQRVDAIHSDCFKDVRIAHEWGLPQNVPTAVAPGNGGVNLEIFKPSDKREALRKKHNLPVDATIIINSRGIKEYIRNEVFFASLPEVFKSHPNTYVVCMSMAGKDQAIAWVKQNNIEDKVLLMPSVPHQQMAEIFQCCDITVSPSEHDGTPNTLLEAMACGVFPVASHIESNLEWITDKENGLIHNPTSKDSIAQSLIEAINQKDLREKAKSMNIKIVQERAAIPSSVAILEDLYQKAIKHFESRK